MWLENRFLGCFFGFCDPKCLLTMANNLMRFLYLEPESRFMSTAIESDSP